MHSSITRHKCPACHGKLYIIAERDDGFLAIEKCDHCGAVTTDGTAALLAQRDGHMCFTNYPCYLIDRATLERITYQPHGDLDEPGCYLVRLTFNALEDDCNQLAVFSTLRKAREGIVAALNESEVLTEEGGPFTSFEDAQLRKHEAVEWWVTSVGAIDSGTFTMEE